MANVITTLLKLDGTQFKAGMRSAQQSIAETDGVVAKAKAGWTSMFASFASSPAVLAGAGAAVSAFAVSSVNAASDLNESINAVNVTFGESADKILEFGDNAAKSVGLAKAEFNELATPLGSILKNAGFDMDTVADKTIVLTQRAADMASVFNTDVSDALGAIQAGLRGEQDPLEKFGVGLSAAKVEARALADTGKESARQLTDQEKQLARVEIILDQTNQTAGDFAATSDGLANQTRILKAEFTNLQAAAGQQLIPVLEDLAGSLLTVEQAAKDAGGAVAKIPGVPEFLKTALRFNPVGQQVTFYQQLGKAIEFAQSKWDDAEPASERFNRSITSLADEAQQVADRTAGVGDAVGDVGTAAATAATQVTDLSEAVKDGGDDWGGYMGAVAGATSAVGGAHGDFRQMQEDLEQINQQARDNAMDTLAGAIAAVGDAIDTAFSDLDEDLGTLDLLDDIAEQFEAVAEASEKANDPQGARDYQREVRRLRGEIADYLETLDGIPPDKITQIIAQIRDADVEGLKVILDDLTKDRFINIGITPPPIQAFKDLNAIFGAGVAPSAPSFSQSAIPSSSFIDQSTTIINNPIGSTPTTQYVDQQLDVRRNGIR